MSERHWIAEAEAGIRRTAKTIKPEDRTYWNVAGSAAIEGHGRWNYESWWDEMFGSRSILTRFLEERIAEGIIPVAFDVAGGDGSAIRDLRTSGLIGVGLTSNLTDTRSPDQKKQDKQLHLGLAPGDIFLGTTWRRRIYPWIKANTESGYVDLIMVRGGGMFQNIMPPEAYLVVFRRMLNVLKPEGGMLIADVPFNLSRFEDREAWEQMKQVFQQLNNSPSMHVDFKKDDTHWPTLLDYLTVVDDVLGGGAFLGGGVRRAWICGTVRVLTGEKLKKRPFLLWGRSG